MFQLPSYETPDFNRPEYRNAPEVRTVNAPNDGILPDDFYSTTIYTVDISEFAVNKLRDRGSLAVNSIVTNVQDFLINTSRSLDVM